MTEEDIEDEYYSVEHVEEEVVPIEDCKVLYTLEECLVDCTDATEKQFEEIKEYCVSDAYYKLVVLRGNQIADTGLKIGWIPEKLESILKEEKPNG